ncbi:hypothetical protein J6TS2_38040 [Heyndrickxia sporothermodurans]|nr:hypothetical protein J6TS2_38040 [Heyndrickxia sporothermodurans]
MLSAIKVVRNILQYEIQQLRIIRQKNDLSYVKKIGFIYVMAKLMNNVDFCFKEIPYLFAGKLHHLMMSY